MKNQTIPDAQIKVLMKVFTDKYKGIKNAASGDDILLYLRGTGQLSINPQTFRELLGKIRRDDLLKPGFIVSKVNTGYWLSTDMAEMDTYLQQELNRMSNQFGNVENLHRRIKYNTVKKPKSQTSLF